MSCGVMVAFALPVQEDPSSNLPSATHFLSGGPWQDLVSSVRLEPLTVYDVSVALKR